MQRRVEDTLRLPYARILIPAEEGGFSAEILEFPGCIAEGDTAEEAIRNLESVAASWIEAALEQGQEVPPPSAVHEYSGRIVLRLPRGLHKNAARLALRDETSLNQYLVAAVSARVGAEDLCERLLDRIEERLAPTARNILIVPESAFYLWHQLTPEPALGLPAQPQLKASSTGVKRIVEVLANA